MRRTTAAAVALLVPLSLGCSRGGDKDDDATPGAQPTCSAATPNVSLPQSFPAPPGTVVDAGKSYEMSIETTCGTIRVDLLAKEAPATASSFHFLAGKGYFDGSSCHRATQTPTLTVLQCGDPTGSGAGGPGYTLPEENLPTADPATGLASYPRGTVAMARGAAPHSGGSQFFLVAKDSVLPPEYTVFGRITSGLEVLDAALAQGIKDTDGDVSTGLDGAPTKPVYITSLRVSER